MSKQQLPDYVNSAQPTPLDKRAGWLMTTAASYAGVMLWFVFWQQVPAGASGVMGGTLSQGLQLAIGSLVLAAFLCYLLCYLVPGLLGMKTGLPLAVVGTSTYGVTGGFLMPGLLMGLLQFGWLSVNAYFSGQLLVETFGLPAGSMVHMTVSTVWAILAMLMGILGIQYVGKVASFSPIIPIVILVILLVKTCGSVGDFDAKEMMKAEAANQKIATERMQDIEKDAVGKFTLPFLLDGDKLAEYKKVEAEYQANKQIRAAQPASLWGVGTFGVVSLVCAYVIGFFATAGAAGADFGRNNKNKIGVHLGGLVGIVLSTAFTGVIALIVVAGAQKMIVLDKDGYSPLLVSYNVTTLFEAVLGSEVMARTFSFLLALAAFPSACFCTFIAANSIKTSFPSVNQWVSCGIGCFAAILLVLTGYAKDAPAVFNVIGASFGPICGAMAADYILSGFKWAGPREGFNPAGWLSWILGFAVGSVAMIYPEINGLRLAEIIPCPPLSAFIVGFVFYIIFALNGLQSKVLDMPQRIDKT
jgi:cytosine permease